MAILGFHNQVSPFSIFNRVFEAIIGGTYDAGDDYSIILQDRIDEVAREITEYLTSTDRMQKTIVFCASEDHAERITEGATDWKHMKAAFSKLSQCPENVEAYRSLDFDFLEYEPEQSTKEGALKIQMSNTQLTSMCKHFASIPQPRKLIFIADADDATTNKEFRGHGDVPRCRAVSN